MFLNTLLSDGLKWYPILFDSPMNVARGVCFWLSIALAVAFALCALLLKGDRRKTFLKIFLFVAVAYACAVGVTLLTLTFLEDGITLTLFAPLVTLIVAIGACAIALCVRRSKLVYALSGILVGGALLAALICMAVYYAQNVNGDGYYNSEETGAYVNQAVLYVSAILLIALIAGGAFLFGRRDKKGFDSKCIAYAAVCIAMSFALSYLRIFKLPQGGSVTVASLLPLMLYSYMFGVRKGVFAGLIYGLLQAVQDPWIIHPAQFLLDYPAAFASIGLAGTFASVKKLNKLPQIQFALGAIVASALRFTCHLLSGVFAFSAYAIDAGSNTWLYSLAYNSFVFADIGIAIAVGVLVFTSKSFVKHARKFHASTEEAPQA